MNRMKVETVHHGRYLIRAAAVAGGGARGFAFLLPPTRRRGPVAALAGASTAEVVQDLCDLLDRRDRAEMRDRRICDVNSVPVPSAAAFRAALEEMKITPREGAMLDAHARAGSAGLSSLLIAEAGGYRTVASANSQYGGLARRFANHLSIGPLPATDDGRTDFATSAIAHQGDRDDGAFVWVMYLELREALFDLGRV
jgi:hypothetical protein